MRKLLLLTGFLCFTLTLSFAQNKKAEKEALAKAQFEKALAAIEAKDFVIIVDTYEASGGAIETNNDPASFLSCENDFIFLQGIVAGNNYTNKLAISDFSKSFDKKGNLKIEMQVKGFYIIAKIEIFLKKDGNYADAIITRSKGSGVERFSGEIVPRGESKYFKRSNEI